MNELVASWMDRLQLISVIVRLLPMIAKCSRSLTVHRPPSLLPWNHNYSAPLRPTLVPNLENRSLASSRMPP